MITLSDGVASVELHKDLLWQDEFTWNKVVQRSQRTLSGGQITQTATLNGGRPFTLAPEDDSSAPTPREVLVQLRNWAAVAGKQMTLTLRGIDYPVVFRHPDDENGAPAVEAKPWIHYDEMEPEDVYLCTFRFLGI